MHAPAWHDAALHCSHRHGRLQCPPLQWHDGNELWQPSTAVSPCRTVACRSCGAQLQEGPPAPSVAGVCITVCERLPSKNTDAAVPHRASPHHLVSLVSTTAATQGGADGCAGAGGWHGGRIAGGRGCRGGLLAAVPASRAVRAAASWPGGWPCGRVGPGLRAVLPHDVHQPFRARLPAGRKPRACRPEVCLSAPSLPLSALHRRCSSACLHCTRACSHMR